MKHIIEHYRNGRNLGDDWWFITKMMLQGNLLTNDRYKLYIDQLFVDAAIETRQHEIATKLGFKLQDHALALYATCSKKNCKNKP